MSHIDSFKHELVGMLYGLPVYHPLEIIYGDFEATSSQLVLGGGSGESTLQAYFNLLILKVTFLWQHMSRIFTIKRLLFS